MVRYVAIFLVGCLTAACGSSPLQPSRTVSITVKALEQVSDSPLVGAHVFVDEQEVGIYPCIGCPGYHACPITKSVSASNTGESDLLLGQSLHTPATGKSGRSGLNRLRVIRTARGGNAGMCPHNWAGFLGKRSDAETDCSGAVGGRGERGGEGVCG
jgi:hypothetical protein